MDNQDLGACGRLKNNYSKQKMEKLQRPSKCLFHENFYGNLTTRFIVLTNCEMEPIRV